ncbi:MAG: polyprenyl synthetase family protein [Bacteroidia bacterium]|nr:polyprenyl synthetase family protein [Bacteroidia bacterium]MDW8302471.1 polyprenyl synthetase family protein [Bacteroidia bacterium]
MLTIQEIQAPIQEELKAFEKYFREAMRSKVLLLDLITQSIIRRKGKQIRPLFVLLSAKLCGGITPATYRGAALVELLHTATLIHDDVVDNADERRGFFSINALWKNKAAVLVGDFLLSRGLLMSLEYDDFNLLKIVSQAVREMSEGELLQMQKARKLNIDEPIYFEIIRQKTASLIAACCACGAASTTEDKEIIERMRQFGEYVGMAFQIKDDLLDYGTDDIGKPLGLDIKERKMTLPLIHALNQAGRTERHRIVNIIRNHNNNKEKINEVIRFVKGYNGIGYSQEMMREYVQKAIKELDIFADSEIKQKMIALVHYTIERNK